MKKIKNILEQKNGQIMLGTIIILLLMSLILSINYFSLNGLNIFLYYRETELEKVFALAESGINRAIFELNQNTDWASTTEEFFLGDGSYEVSVIDLGNEKIIESTGYIPNKQNYKFKRTLRATATKSPGFSSFKYGAQSGFGGVELNSNAIIFGNVYSNSSILCYSNSYISGDAFVVQTISPPNCAHGQSATGSQPIPLPEFNRNYWIQKAESGGTINGNVSYNSGINYLGPKRINGNLTLNTNATLIITGPIYATGTVSLNSNSIAKLDDSFDIDGTVILSDNTISVNNNAQILRAESYAIIRPIQDYNSNWNASPNPPNYEAINDIVEEPSIPNTSDYIWSNIGGQTNEFVTEQISNATSASQITVWVYARNTDESSGDMLGINLIIDGNSIGEKTIPLNIEYNWASANFTFNSPLNKNQLDNLRVKIKEIKSGSQDSVYIAALYAKVKYIKQNAGYLMFVSDKSNSLAIELNGNAEGGVFYARYGTIQVNSNSHPIALTGNKLVLNSNAQLWYDEGLPSQSFTSGPGGRWLLKPGSLVIVE